MLSRKYSVYEASIEEWASILRLAHIWQCDEIRDLAFRELDKLDVPHVERVLLTTRYDAHAEWREKALEDLSKRPKQLSLDEGKLLGIELTVHVAQLREQQIRERIRRIATEAYSYGEPVRAPSPIIVHPPSLPSSHSGTSTH